MVSLHDLDKRAIAHEMRLSVIREPHIWKFDKLIDRIEYIIFKRPKRVSDAQHAALNYLFVRNLHMNPHVTSSYTAIVDRIETIVLRWEIYERECEIIELKTDLAKLKRENNNLRGMIGR